jgi:hypothetical protein
METKGNTEIRIIKFIIPPITSFLFIFLAIIINPNRDILLNQTLDFFSKLNPIISILASITTIMGIGFIISSLTFLIVGNFILKPHWNEWAKGVLKTNFKFKELNVINNIEEEVTEWLVQEQYSDYIKKKIEKRWEMFSINANSSISLLLTLIIIHYLNIFSCCWFVLWLLFMIVCVLNSIRTWNNISGIDHFLLRNTDFSKSNKF